jgi:serine/threonine protein kinase
MGPERFIRCRHCNLPHEAGLAECPVTNRPIEAEQAPQKRRAEPPPSEESYSWEHSIHGWEAEQEDDLPDPALLVGRVLEKKYRIDEMIGRGAMGAVFRAENLRIGKPVAIKVLQYSAADTEYHRRFLREARIAGSLGHPNIVEVFDLGNLEDGRPFQVMELLSGATFEARIQSEGALREDEVLEIADQVLAALDAAHAKGIVHRDLKPENVFLARREQGFCAKLLDFGVSKTITEHSLAITMTGAVVGTPYYCSPEQARGDSRIDHRADLWAMGVTLYRALTGVYPFTGKAYPQLLARISRGKPHPPSRLQPRLTPAVDRAILRALSVEPSERFSSAAEMREALRSARRLAAELDAPAEASDGSDTEVSDSFVHKQLFGERKS